MLSSVKSNLDRAAVYLSDARAMGIHVLTPDINQSVTDFAALLPDDVRRASTSRWEPGRSRSVSRPCATSAKGWSSNCWSSAPRRADADFHEFAERHRGVYSAPSSH